MDPEITIQPPLTLRGFCEAVLTRHSAKWPPDEGLIAQEFVLFFQTEKLLGFTALQRFCQGLEVAVSIQKLPRELRGHNHRYQGKREIVIGTPAQGPPSASIWEHTLFHELRELLEYEFRELGCPVANSFSDLEARAERFASSVRAFGAIKSWQPLLESIGEVKSTWARVGLGLLAVGILGFTSLGCLLLPSFEGRLSG